MDTERLAELIERPEIHRRLLAGYCGAYSLGIGELPNAGHKPALILQVEADGGRFPHEIKVDGETVPVVVETGFETPHSMIRN